MDCEERTLLRNELLVGGQWVPGRSGQTEEVRSPYDGTVVGVVPTGGLEDVDAVLAAAERGATIWPQTPAHERMRILLRAAELADERTADIARIISAENGKTITEATVEAGGLGGLFMVL